MIKYNVTAKIDHTIHELWLEWMLETHIPEVMQSHCFEKWSLNRLLGIDEQDGVTYAVQYHCPSAEKLQFYQDNFATALQADYKKKFAGKYVVFRSLLEVVAEG